MQYTGSRGFHFFERGPLMFILSRDLPGTRKGEEQDEDAMSPHFVSEVFEEDGL